MRHVLLVEDSIDSQILVSRALRDAVNLEIAGEVSKAKEFLGSREYDLVLLDVDLPDGSGFGFCSSLLADTRSKRPRVIFLTGSQGISEKLTGFSLGADDYITKPFDPLELKARVLAHLRAHAELIQSAQVVQCGNIRLNLMAHTAEIDDLAGLPVTLDLTPTEFKLLSALIKNEGRVLSREQLLVIASDHAEDICDRTIDAHISKLRKKLSPSSSHIIEGVYGIGYRLIRVQS